MVQPQSLVLFQLAAIVTTAVALWLAVVAWRQRPARGAGTLVLLMLAVAIWASALAWLMSFQDETLRLVGVKYGYLGIVSAPVLCFLFAAIYTGYGRGRSLRRGWLWLLWIVPAITLSLAWGYPRTHLLWREFSNAAGGYVQISYGPWIVVSAAYSWLLLVLGALSMSWYAFSVRGVYRRTALLVAAALVLPLAPNVVWVLRLVPGLPLDFTFVGMLVSAVLLLAAVKWGDFLLMRPVAAVTLMEQIADAILVVNTELKVVDCNRAAMTDLGLAALPRGQPLSALLERSLAAGEVQDSDARWLIDQLMDAFQPAGDRSGDLVVTHPRLRHFHWRISPLGDDAVGDDAGWLVVWRDVTEDRLQLAMLYEQERALRQLVEHQRQESQQAAHTQRMLADLLRRSENALDLMAHGDVVAGAAVLVQMQTLASQSHQGAGLVAQPDLAAAGGGDGASFLDAVAESLQGYGRAIDCPVTFTCRDPLIPELLSSWTLVQLMRILQETLDGICRLAAVAALQVVLATAGDQVTLEIVFTFALPIEDEQTSAPEVRQAALERWLAEGSVQRRLAAAAGQITCAVQDRTGWVMVCLPQAGARRQAQLRGQRVLLGTATPASAQELGDLLAAHGMEIVGAATDLDQLVTQARTVRPQLILADLDLINRQPAAVRRLRLARPDAGLFILLASADAEADPGEAVRHGADGYLLMTLEPDRLVAMLADLLNHDLPMAVQPTEEFLLDTTPPLSQLPELTKRQQEILALMVEGFTYREIAAQLYLSERSVRYGVEEMRQLLQVSKRSELVDYALKHHLA